MTPLSFRRQLSTKSCRCIIHLLLAVAVCVGLLNSNVAQAQPQSEFRSTPSSTADSTSRVPRKRSMLAHNGRESEWTAADEDSGKQPATAACDEYRNNLEAIREEKRKRLEAIHRRLQALLDNQTASASDVFKPQFNQEPSPEKPMGSADEPKLEVGQNNRDSPKTNGDNPEARSTPLSNQQTVTPSDKIQESSPTLIVPSIPDPPASSQPDTTPQSPETIPTVVMGSGDQDQTARPIADMIDALTGAPTVLPTTAEEEEEPPPPPITATTVLNSPVDRLKLADNLFAAGEHALALQMYEAIDHSKISSSDRVWLSYQQASCNRRMGKIAEAESIYRQIAGESDAEWLAETSRWWLDRLSDRKELDDELRQIQDVLDTFEKAKMDANNTTQ